MRNKTKDRIYELVPMPVLQQVLPRFAAARSPFIQEIIDRRVIFVHIPKAGGTSLKTELYGRARGGHRSIADFFAYDEPRTEAFFKCAFVRNPWDRLVSAFFWLHLGQKPSALTFLGNDPDFDKFVHRLTERAFREQVIHYDHFRSQTHWISLPGAKTHHLDFLGRYESLAPDLVRLRQRLAGFDGDLVGAAPQQVPARPDQPEPPINWSRQGKHAPYRDLYTDSTREIVADLYADDIALLGYSF